MNKCLNLWVSESMGVLIYGCLNLYIIKKEQFYCSLSFFFIVYSNRLFNSKSSKFVCVPFHAFNLFLSAFFKLNSFVWC